MLWIAKVTYLNKNDAAAKANQTAQTDFYKQLTANYNTDFGKFEGAMDSLQSKLDPIINAGPGQYGYSTAEDAAIRSQAANTDAAAAQNAEVATNQQITAENGGADVLPTGAAEQLKQQGDVAAAQKNSTDQTAITEAGYTQGNTNYNNALTATQNDLGLMNPNSFASASTSGGTAATGAVTGATNAAAASDSWMTMVGGALGGAGSALSGSALMRGVCWIAAELYGGWFEPRTVLVREWLSAEFEKSLTGKFLMDAYTRHGRQIADTINKHRWLRFAFLPFFNKALHRARIWKTQE